MLYLLLMLLLSCLVPKSESTLSRCDGIEYYKLPSKGSTRFTAILEGNFSIQAIMSFSNECENVDIAGIIRTYAIRYVVEEANKNSLIAKHGKIGLRLDDACRDLPQTMARGVEVISLIRENSVCREDFLQCQVNSSLPIHVQPTTALIGTGMSYTTIPLASLMSLYQIPQISYSASSRLLSKVDLYKSFFRTIPSDTNQMSVMLDIMEAFDWNFIFAIGSDDDYGKLGIEELKKQAGNRNKSICVPFTEYLAYRSSEESIESRIQTVVSSVKNQTKAQVVVLFCYVNGLGDLILKEAERQGVKRIWMTSDAWNPKAEALTPLKNQSHGILSVSLKRYKQNYLLEYIKEKVAEDVQCNPWLQEYIEREFNCSVNSAKINKTFSGDDCEIAWDKVMEKVLKLPGKISNLIDATRVLTQAIREYIETICEKETDCNTPHIDYTRLTEIVRKVNFVNDQDVRIRFDKNGDPEDIFYTIDNLQWVNGTLKYKTVGTWNATRSQRLIINKYEIHWPYWFQRDGKQHHPGSRCHEDCKPGQYYVGLIGCCWKCNNCSKNYFSNTTMAKECLPCGIGKHTRNFIECEVTPISWTTYSSTEGLAVVFVSSIGLLFTIVASILLIYFRSHILTDESSMHIVTLSCVLLFVSFAFGYLHIFEPTEALCHTRNAMFFLLFIAYTSILLIKTRIVSEYLERNLSACLGNRVFLMQIMLLLFFMLIEVASIVVWLIVDDDQKIVDLHPIENDFKSEKRCFVDFTATATRLMSTFPPAIILIIATFCAFRERNQEHSFYEPKFLSFTCIAMLIITVAFLPTFKYVSGNFKGIVMAFMTGVLGFTYMACLILPKIYVGHARQKNGESFIHPKPSKTAVKAIKSFPDNDPIDLSTQHTTSIDELTTAGVDDKTPNGSTNGFHKEINNAPNGHQLVTEK